MPARGTEESLADRAGETEPRLLHRHEDPEQPDYRELLDSVIKADHWSDEKTDREIQEDIGCFMNHGMSRKEAEDYCRQMNGIVRFLKQHADSVSLTQARGIMISYGGK